MPDPKYVPPTGGRCLIEKLIPDDLLSYIFRLGTEAQTNDEEWFVEEDDGDENFEDVETEEAEEAQDEAGAETQQEERDALTKMYDATDPLEQNAVWSLPFQVRVSHVCRRWRHTALDLSLLWSSVSFAHRIPLDQSKEWIARAKDCPLDITIDIPIYPQDVSSEDGEDANADLQLYSQHSKEEALANLEEVLDVVVPVVDRWEEFDLSVTSWDQMHLALTRLANCHAKPGAPMLKALSLFCDEDTGYERFLFPEFKGSKLLFGGNAPKLERLGLWSVHLDWTLLLPRSTRLRQLTHASESPGDTSNLVEMELAFHATDVRPSFDQFAAIVAHSPRLEALKLSCSGPAFSLEHNTTERISIPSLNTLVLGSHSEDYAMKLVRAFYMPNLTGLCLDLADSTLSDFVRCLAEPVRDPREDAPVFNTQETETASQVSRPTSILSNLTSLKLSGLMCEDACGQIVYENATRLKSLYLNMQFLPDPFFLLLLSKEPLSWEDMTEDRVSRIIQNAEYEPLYLPQLETLTVGGSDGVALVALVAARKAARIPLKVLNVSHTSDVSPEARVYIRHNVDDAQYVILSDDELEDEEDGDEAEEGDEDEDGEGDEEDGDNDINGEGEE